jgi:hypothetical protein
LRLPHLSQPAYASVRRQVEEECKLLIEEGGADYDFELVGTGACSLSYFSR